MDPRAARADPNPGNSPKPWGHPGAPSTVLGRSRPGHGIQIPKLRRQAMLRSGDTLSAGPPSSPRMFCDSSTDAPRGNHKRAGSLPPAQVRTGSPAAHPRVPHPMMEVIWAPDHGPGRSSIRRSCPRVVIVSVNRLYRGVEFIANILANDADLLRGSALTGLAAEMGASRVTTPESSVTGFGDG